MLENFTEEDVWCVVVETNNTYARISQWYTRQWNAQQKLKQFTKYASMYPSNYAVMKFKLTQGELIENPNS